VPALRVTLTPTAIEDLGDVEVWLNQPGAGRLSRSLALRIVTAIEDLQRTWATHPVDRFRDGYRQRTVGRFVISYRMTVAVDGDVEVLVERVYGPGERRP
jgi:plasmid stabilization system protein ParE